MSTAPENGHGHPEPGLTERRLHALALGLDAVAVSATISHRTYAAPDVATLETMAGPAARATPVEVALPRMTIQYLDDAGAAPSALAEGTSDLIVRSLIGEGGMGRVFAAEQRSIGREVVIKVLRNATDGAASSSLVAEARIAGSLEHPHIVPIHSLGVDSSDRPLIVMKRVPGVSWAVLLREPSHPTWSGLLLRNDGDRLAAHLDVFSAVCDALDFAHAAGVLHRDVKPDNVLVGSWGETYLTDWGVAARLADLTGAAGAPIVGTPAYMAPEMVARELGAPDPRTDVYLLGATLFEVLTGSAPHERPSMLATLHHAFVSAPPSFGADVPAELAALCTRAMARAPADRPRSAAEFRKGLHDYLTHRAAARLTDEATATLATLRSTIARDPTAPSIAVLGAECRFTFKIALRDWAQNAPARQGLDACLALLIERELDRQGHETARALLLELVDARPDLEARVVGLEQHHASRLERAAQDKRLLRDQDQSVSRRLRARASAGVSVVSGAIVVLEAAFARSVGARVAVAAAASVVIIAMVATAWRRIARAGQSTRIGQQIGATVAIAPLLILANRSLGWVTGASLAQVCVSDLTLFGAYYLVSAICIEPRLFAAGGLSLSGAVVAALAPSHARWVFAVTLPLFAVAASIAWRGRGEAAHPSGAPAAD